jgi:DNA-binding protein HU-beta
VRTVWDREAASSNLAAPTNLLLRIGCFPHYFRCNPPDFSSKVVLIFTIKDWRITQTMARMTQTEIVNQLADKSGLKKTEVKGLFDAIADLATKEVKKNGEFTLPGFGKLVKATRKAREGRNPATGAVIKIPAKTTVKFRLGKSMKDAVGGK